jgi:RNA polymerase sigma factor (sigma-70 family)
VPRAKKQPLSRRQLAAANELAEKNIGLAFKFANSRWFYVHKRTHVELEDFQQMMLTALMRASRAFDASRGAKFSTYAFGAMDYELRRHIKFETFTKRRVNRITYQFAVGAEGEDIVTERIEDPTAPASDAVDLRELLESVLWKLSDQQRAIIHARFFEERILKDVAEEMGLSKERVRQIQNQALTKCRELLSKRSHRYLDIAAQSALSAASSLDDGEETEGAKDHRLCA